MLPGVICMADLNPEDGHKLESLESWEGYDGYAVHPRANSKGLHCLILWTLLGAEAGQHHVVTPCNHTFHRVVGTDAGKALRCVGRV